MEREKKYTGRGGYHGGGRKKLPDGQKKIFKTVSISGTPEELDALKQVARNRGKSVSRLILDYFLFEEKQR